MVLCENNNLEKEISGIFKHATQSTFEIAPPEVELSPLLLNKQQISVHLNKSGCRQIIVRNGLIEIATGYHNGVLIN